ncbi:MAG: hypothetical protein RR744_10660 [Cellulosilyticaceae bacterium]
MKNIKLILCTTYTICFLLLYFVGNTIVFTTVPLAFFLLALMVIAIEVYNYLKGKINS